MALTVLSIERLAPRTKRFEVPDGVVRGLYISVLPSGAKSWCVRYRHNGRPRNYNLGPFPTVKLADARKRAGAAMAKVAAGHDPAGEKAEKRRRELAGLDKENLFAAVWERYLTEYVKRKLKPSTAGEMERLGKTQILPKFKRRKLTEIAPHDIKTLMAAQRTRGAPTQANKVFATLRSFFNWCVRELLLERSPCAGLQKTEKEEPRDRVLSDQEITWLWRACDEIDFPFGPVAKLLLLTGTRRDEARALRRRELDRDARLWTLPPDRTKNGKEHSVYLADATLELLRTVPEYEGKAGYVFTTSGETPVSGFSRAKARLDKLMAKYAAEADKTIDPWVIHDLRRTVASGMARLSVALPVIERALNHISGSFGGIVGVYQKHEFAPEKKDAFERWAAHVTGLVSAR